MKAIVSIAGFAIGLMALPALADQASFREAFVNVCIKRAPTLTGAHEELLSRGFEMYQGAGSGEYEGGKGTTSIFLATAESDIQPGCTVMDENVSIDFAYTLLAETLDLAFEGVRKGTGYQDEEVWRVLTDTGTLIFSVDEDMSGAGGAISFELRP